MPSRTVTLELGGAKVRVIIRGDGEPLVLVHGLGGSTAWWIRNVDVFSRKYTVYLVDLPGFGSMRKHAKQFSVGTSAAWLADVLSALNVERSAMIGHSMGGLIAAMFAAKYPNRVSKLVLAAPALGLVRKSLLSFFIPLAKETMYVPPTFVPTLVRDAVRTGPLTVLRAGRELLLVDATGELARVSNPCLLIFGERDAVVPIALGRKLESDIKGSRLLVLPGAGHILMYDRADLFNDAVLEFLSDAAG